MARREVNVFNVSFLDCIFCGFGAVVLLFVIINARATVQRLEKARDLSGLVQRLQREVLDQKKDLIVVSNTLEQKEDERVRTEGEARRLENTLEEKKLELSRYENETLSSKDHINRLIADLQSLEEDYKRLKAAALDAEGGDKIKSFKGDGDRQYLTGVKMGGKRVLILVDASASMLGRQVVDVIIRRNRSDSVKRASPKWQQAVKTVDWLTTQLPAESQFQIYTFNETAKPLLPRTAGTWLDGADPETLREVMAALRQVVPEKGTSLHQAFAVLDRMESPADNLFVLADGLPTMTEKRPSGGMVSGRNRLRFFDRAKKLLPRSLPVNVVLFPMEGDPMAASSYWRLAVKSKGSFFSPSEDWP